MIIYGIHPVAEALTRRPRAVKRVFATRRRATDFVASVRAAGVRLESLEGDALERLAVSDQHQGVAADVEPVGLADLDSVIRQARTQGEPLLLMVLDTIQDPHNFGSLVRTAACCGAHAVIFPRHRAAGITAVVHKASAGAVEHVSLCRVVNIAATLQELKRQGIWVAGTLPDARQSLYEFDAVRDLAVVIGSEGAGMRRLVSRACDIHLAIPMTGGVASLNAAVAGAVVLFEVQRQRLLSRAG